MPAARTLLSRLNPLPWLLGYRGVPLLARSTFRHDLLAGVCAAAAAGVLLPDFAQLFVIKTLHGPAWLMAVLVSQVAAGNLFGSLVAQHLQRRRRIPYVVAARIGAAIVLLALALLPADDRSLLPFTAMLFLPAILGAVALNVQTGIWHSNYPERSRGQVFARLSISRLLAAVAAVKLAGYALDRWPHTAHHGVFAAAAVLMAVSGLFLARIRVRRERSLLRQGQAQAMRLLGSLHVLRRDRPFAQYMLWQMISGGSVLLSAPVIVPALTRAFPAMDYAQGTTLLFLAPLLTQVFASPLAGRLFDSVGIMRYRAFNACLWAFSRAVVYAAILAGSWPLVLAGAVVQGLAQASGDVVWHIGHTRFSAPQQGQLYMGVHMTLHGLRGLTLPFLGAWLYQTPGIGLHVMGIAVAIQLVAAVEFFYSKPPGAVPPGAAPPGEVPELESVAGK